MHKTILLIAAVACAGWLDAAPLATLDPREAGGRSWTSAAVALPARRGPLDVRLRFVCRGPVEVNGRLVFADASGRAVGEQFLWPSLKVVPRAEWGRANTHAVTVQARQIPAAAKTAALRISLAHRPAAGAEAPLFEVTDAEILGASMPLGTAFANWFTAGEDVVFSAPLPAGGTGVRGVVVDSAGREVFRADAAGDTWRWPHPPIGFYTVRFAWLDATGAARPCAGAGVRACGHIVEGDVIYRDGYVEFPRAEQNFVVCATAPRAVEDCPPMFGFNVASLGVDTAAFAQIRLLGMHAFIRYHHFQWDAIERKGRGQYDWTAVDTAFAQARQAGYGFDRILVNTFGTPLWLTSAANTNTADRMHHPRYHAPRDLAPWHDFVKAFCARYPEMRYLELWNEPHLPGYSIFWQKASPAQFVELLKAGYLGAKEANPRVTVLMGGVGMRYQPFYEEFVKLGGVRWFDQLDTHCGYNMQHFRDTETRHGAEHKPYWEGEWHTVLYNCGDPNPPDEETCAYRMLTNMADLIHEGNRRVTGFGLNCGEHVPETASFYGRKTGIHQVSGLFRSRPFLEPRLAALALRTATDRFRGDIRRRGAWAFGEDGAQRVCAFESDAGCVAFAWNENPKGRVGGWTPEFAAVARGRKILDWEGRETTLAAMGPRRVYFVLEPDLAAAARGVALAHLDYTSYNYKPPRSLDRGSYGVADVAARLPLRPMGEKPLAADFAAALDASALTLDVRMAKGVAEVLRVAVDVEGHGLLDDVVEFEVRGDGRIVKPRTPQLKGDIPTEFSPANVPLTRSRLVRAQEKDGERWRASFAMGDLYPFVHAPGRMVRLIVRLEGGAGADPVRAQWGDGWGRIKKPELFGSLRPSGGGRVLATQGDIRRAFGEGEVVPGDVARVRATGGRKGAGFTIHVRVEPGSTLRARGRVRGQATVLPSVWASAGRRGAGRINAPRVSAGAEWTDFDVSWDLPPTADVADVVFFTWRDPGAAFEVREFRLVDE